MSYDGVTGPAPGQTAYDIRTAEQGINSRTYVQDSNFSQGTKRRQDLYGATISPDVIPSKAAANMAINDEYNLVWQQEFDSFSGVGAAMLVFGAIGAGDIYGVLFGTEPWCRVEFDGNLKCDLVIRANGVTQTSALTGSALFSAGAPQWCRLRFKRTGATACEVEFYQFSGGTWVSKIGPLANANWTANAIRGGAFGFMAGSPTKGGAGFESVGLGILGFNEIPVTTAKMVYLLPDDDSDLLEWTPNSGSLHYDRVRSAIQAPSSSEYIESGATGGATKTDRIKCNDLKQRVGTIYAASVRVKHLVSPGATGRAKVGIRLSGTDSTLQEVRDASGNDWAQFHFGLDPASAAWTADNINKAEIVVKRENTANNWRIDELALGVLYEPQASLPRSRIVAA